MFRRDTSVRFEAFGFWIFKRFHFVAGKLELSYGKSEYDQLLRMQAESPVKVMSDEIRRRSYWMFRDDFYWEDEDFTEVEVQALALERQNQRNRRTQRAVALMEQKDLPASPRRAPISQALRLAVFQRDGGRCVDCGSDQGLQFDHVIPVALGGASSEANLQVLCEICNRAKGAALA